MWRRLQQSIYLMLAQPPTITTTYTLQTFSSTTSFAVPNVDGELNIELYTDPVDGIDKFRLLPLSFDEIVAGLRRKAA